MECAKVQKVEFQYGDTLSIRSGWLVNYHTSDSTTRHALSKAKPTFVGIEQISEVLDLSHDNYFSAVAGDTPAFEARPTN
jgi:hypothetical protein